MLLLVTMARPRSTMHPHLWNQEAGADLAVPAARAGREAPVATDRAAQAARVDRECTVLADQEARVDRVGPVPVDRVGPVTTVPVDRVDRDSTARVDRVAPALGTGMTTAAISTVLRGATGQHPGVPANRRGRHGTARFRLRVGRGTTDRSTTGATRILRSGTRSSISSDSTSSEFGSRCKDPPLQTPASPIGGAGVAPVQLYGLCAE
jgi:mRNA-degrading endonuclease toxin of MazEF toxin-antitoxin module